MFVLHFCIYIIRVYKQKCSTIKNVLYSTILGVFEFFSQEFVGRKIKKCLCYTFVIGKINRYVFVNKVYISLHF